MAPVLGQGDGAGDLFRALTSHCLFTISSNSSFLHKVDLTFHQAGAWRAQIRSTGWIPRVNSGKPNFPPPVWVEGLDSKIF